jgi:uncharacterized membrane protein YphA (DoxX/SURF4 family)
MPITRVVARPLLASVFAVGGLDAVLHPETDSPGIATFTDQLARHVSLGPHDARRMVKVNGMVQVGAATLISLGRFRRVAALALIASIIPTTYAGHRFWEEPDELSRRLQLMHFLRNAGLVGGLLLEAFDTEGRPSLAWRAKQKLA